MPWHYTLMPVRSMRGTVSAINITNSLRPGRWFCLICVHFGQAGDAFVWGSVAVGSESNHSSKPLLCVWRDPAMLAKVMRSGFGGPVTSSVCSTERTSRQSTGIDTACADAMSLNRDGVDEEACQVDPRDKALDAHLFLFFPNLLLLFGTPGPSAAIPVLAATDGWSKRRFVPSLQCPAQGKGLGEELGTDSEHRHGSHMYGCSKTLDRRQEQPPFDVTNLLISHVVQASPLQCVCVCVCVCPCLG
ncbi:hypothetical protein LX36DRAFT_382730 [Colletotrichum falcatum]|nr:hypothetical protein LX36DRAFT_382730 [Colletotrichum falcatum]